MLTLDRSHQIRISAALLVTLVFAGTASSASAAPDGGHAKHQSKLQACNIMAAAMDELTVFSDPEQVSALQSDPAAAMSALDGAVTALNKASKKVTNKKVKGPARKAAAATKHYVAAMKSLIDNPTAEKQGQLGTNLKDFTDGVMGISTVCSG